MNVFLIYNPIKFFIKSGLLVFFLLVNIIHVSAQTEEFLPSADLEVNGIPTLTKSLVADINKYNYSFGWPLVGWNDLGTELILKNKSGGFSFYLASIPGKSPKLWLRHKETALYDIYPGNNNQFFIYNKDQDGNEFFQMYLYHAKEKKQVLLSDGTSRDTEPIWSRSGQQIVYSCSKRDQLGVSLCIVDPFTRQRKKLVVEANGNYFVAQDWSPDDRYIVYCEFFSNTLSRVWLKDTKFGNNIPLTNYNKSDKAYYDKVQFSPDGTGIYFVTDKNHEYRRPAYMNLKTRKIKYLVNGIDWDVENISLNPDGVHLALVFNVNGVSKLYIYNTITGVNHSFDTIDDGVIDNLNWNPKATLLAFNFISHRTPGDVRVLDLSESKITTWVKGFTGNLNIDEWQSPKIISWESFDGKVITGYMYLPPNHFVGKRPVIIDIHGGPEDQYRPGFGYSENYFINELGIVKIYPNIRGSVGYGKSFLNLDNGVLRTDAVKDIGALIDWIKKQPDLDSKKILVQGASYGGYVSLSVATLFSSSIKAVIAESMPTNLATFISSTKGWRRQIQRLEYGDERNHKFRVFMNESSPLNHVQHIKVPVFIIHGHNDVRAPISQAKALIDKLKNYDIPLWTLIAHNEGHTFINMHAWLYRLCSTAQFINSYLVN